MANTYYIITSNAKGGAASPFTGDTAQVKEVTEAELKKIYQDSGQIQDTFGTFDNYMNYVVESQDWVKSADWMNATVQYGPEDPELLYQLGEDVMYAPGERERIQQKIDSDLYSAKMSAWYNWLGQGKDLMDKYGLNNTIYNSDGDQFRWTGSGYQKTIKVDDHADFGDYFKAILQTTVVAGLTAGLGQTAVGAQLNGFFTNLGLSQTAASAATSSILTSGLQQVVSGEFDLQSLAAGAIGAGIGAELAGLANLSGAAGSALASASASAVEQAITNGEINLGDVLKSGLLGGGAEIGKDLFDSLISGNSFDFGGLLSEDSELFAALNGTQVDGEWVGGILGNIRGGVNEFFTKYITGGEWWEAAGGNYKNLEEVSPGQWVATNWDGTTENLSMVALIKKGFETGFYGGFEPTTGESAIWDLIKNNLDQVPDSWYDSLYDWMNTASKTSGGGYTTDSGTTITTQTTGTEESGETPATFDCSSVNRVQTPNATKESECGACLEGYQSDEFGECVDVSLETETGVCPEGQVYNEITGSCTSELFFEEGQPCNTADGQQGLFDSDGNCYVPTAGTGSGVGEEETGGTQAGSSVDSLCSQPRPEEYGYSQINWDKYCAETVTTTGTGTAAAGGTEGCSNGATTSSGCETCPDGSKPADHPDGKCPSTGVVVDQSSPDCPNGAIDSGTCVECPDGTSVSGPDEQCSGVTTATTGAGGSGTAAAGSGSSQAAYKGDIKGLSYQPQEEPGYIPPNNIDAVAAISQFVKSNLKQNSTMHSLFKELIG